MYDLAKPTSTVAVSPFLETLAVSHDSELFFFFLYPIPRLCPTHYESPPHSLPVFLSAIYSLFSIRSSVAR